MAIRIRFRITERTDLYFSPTAKRLTFVSVPDKGIEAKNRFSAGLGGGASFSIVCENADVLDQLTLGSEHYFDITPVK
jgi:hypothetical protein